MFKNSLRRIIAKKDSLLVFVLGVIFAYLVLNIFSYVQHIYEYDTASYDYSVNAVHFRVKDSLNSKTLDLEFVYDFPQINSVNIFKGGDNCTSTYNCLVLNQYPSPVSGKPLNVNERGTAYVGSCASEIFDLTNLEIFGKKYSVIGVFESDISTQNYSMYYASESINSVKNDDYFVIDGQYSKSINAVYNYIDEKLQEKGIETYIIEPDRTHVSDFLSYRRLLIWFVVTIILLVGFSNVILSVYWINVHMEYIQIAHMIGIKNIALRLMWKMIIIYSFAAIVGCTLFYFEHESVPIFIVPLLAFIMAIIVLCSFPLATKAADFNWMLMENDYESF